MSHSGGLENWCHCLLSLEGHSDGGCHLLHQCSPQNKEGETGSAFGCPCVHGRHGMEGSDYQRMHWSE